MKFIIDKIINKKYGKLTVIKFIERTERITKKGTKNGYKYFFLCKCECGNTKVVEWKKLKSGNTKSCGCIRKEKTSQMAMKHNLWQSKLYTRWHQIKNRCYNKNYNRYKNYGGRGIVICDEWKNDFKAFYDWAMNNGYKENLTIDRIDINGNYEPNNCRWITNYEQQHNKRNNKLLTYKGETKCIAEWARIMGLSHTILTNRIFKYKWDIEKAFFTPSRKTK